MARISLLFSLALVLAISSVSAHPPSHKKTQKSLCPPTLAGLQTFPSVEISKLLEKKIQSAPKTIQFNALFAICKSYNDYLAAFKFAGVNNVFGLVHAKYALMNKAMLAAQASVGVEGKLAVKLGKSYNLMAGGFVELVEKIAEISSKYKFDDNAKICKTDRAKIEECLITLKDSISVFLKVVTKCSKKFSAQKQIGLPVLPGAGFFGSFLRNGVGFGGKLIGLGGHGQVEAGAGAGVGGKAGAKLGGKAGAKIGAHAGVKLGTKAGAHVGGKIGAKVGAQGEAKVGAHGRGFLGFGGQVQYGAAGKAKFAGGDVFRSLRHPRGKHLN